MLTKFEKETFREFFEKVLDRLELVESQYSELISEVEDKHEGQTRHDRALWILRENKRVHDAYENASGT